MLPGAAHFQAALDGMRRCHLFLMGDDCRCLAIGRRRRFLVRCGSHIYRTGAIYHMTAGFVEDSISARLRGKSGYTFSSRHRELSFTKCNDFWSAVHRLYSFSFLRLYRLFSCRDDATHDFSAPSTLVSTVHHLSFAGRFHHSRFDAFSFAIEARDFLQRPTMPPPERGRRRRSAAILQLLRTAIFSFLI